MTIHPNLLVLFLTFFIYCSKNEVIENLINDQVSDHNNKVYKEEKSVENQTQEVVEEETW